MVWGILVFGLFSAAVAVHALSDCSPYLQNALEECQKCVINLVNPMECLSTPWCHWANYQCEYQPLILGKALATSKPTKRATLRPTKRPTFEPTPKPSKRPTFKPTPKPSKRPTFKPTPKQTTHKPSKRPTFKPTPKQTTPKPTPKTTTTTTTHAPFPLSSTDQEDNPQRKNILLVIGDDLRQTPIAPAGSTPHLDKFRAQSLTFDYAHCNVPLCGPSRASFLNGREPLETGVYGNKMVVNNLGPKTKTLPQLFKDNGYVTQSFGKVFHVPALNDFSSFSADSWTSIPVPRLARQDTGYLMKNCLPSDINESTKDKKNWTPFAYGSSSTSPIARPYQCNMGTPLADFDDMYIASNAVRELAKLDKRQPFFFLVGFYRPHIPHTVHASVWEQFEIDLAKNASAKFVVTQPKYTTGPEPRQDMPERFAIEPDERSGAGAAQIIPNVYSTPLLPKFFVQAMRAGYAAAMMQMDLALGVLMQGLEDNGMDDNTLVVLVGDNGFNLGESSLWYKQLLTDHSARVPMSVRLPGGKLNAGTKSDALVELLDLYRTLADFAGLPVESAIAGKSMMPVVNSPQTMSPSRDAAFSIIHRCVDRQCADWNFKQVGFSIRTAQYRYNVWLVAEGVVPSPAAWDQIAGEELYDHTVEGDEDHFNLAANPNLQPIKLELFARIKNRYSKFPSSQDPPKLLRSP
ncbi:hypothetical protein BASA82_000281 [Batrachochytrium salamandrivorans]|nr:hypothetical protein BASA81_002546 [Batrachochytrium salamandrivorans]KAH9262678.1 hypothetical protein BASA82_000281 [Batrachochytrium salamandrivorans]